MTEVMAKADQWTDCYAVPWKGLLVENAFKHPAKCSKALADRIYEHAVERGWIERERVMVTPELFEILKGEVDNNQYQ